MQLQEVSIIRQNKIICEKLSLALIPSDVVGVLGPNGRGKTTFLHTLAGLLTPNAGQIHISNEDIFRLSRKQLALKLSLLLQQEIPALPISVRDSILMGGYARKAMNQKDSKLNTIVQALNLHPLLSRNLLTLSGGEQRRVSIARVLFQETPIYLLDEPTNHLDPVMANFVMEYFSNLSKQGALVVISGHHIQLMQLFCSRFLLLLPDGKCELVDSNEFRSSNKLAAVFEC